MTAPRDHGGALDAAIARWGGTRADWIDLSTGINPVPYPLPPLAPADWCALPDAEAARALDQAARRAWSVPEGAAVLAAPGASALIATLPFCLDGQSVQIRHDTYNEHAAAFRNAGWTVETGGADARVIVHPNNPTGEFCAAPQAGFTVIDESFCDTAPQRSHIAQAGPGCVILKSFGKFWGLAGLRLGFAIGDPQVIAAMRARLGPWPVAGPALRIGAAALADTAWADTTRARLTADADRLDRLVARAGAVVQGDCPLFRLYTVPDARAWQGAFARHHILTRTFPYAPTWLRLGLPAPEHWPRLRAACGTVGGASAQPRVTPRP
ncbi:aminotransferase class I/II-fold pyridoxal phosphate-dependent enzyme [Oceaniglobus trochenteri]|uniref:aminotransferase class I/II-fold pyridoxal phosphate-dependent enzyme n=1 Tax=Oceaniglobus trochenteri TaxID=2763260 RepID=UPI001CFFF984|nr:aminotransferase class I/II-fold pyridoxal phosphate-dependent enzyme [Oceaniglobus trochenteri]